MITGFVFVMMVVIEYLNVLTHGRWEEGLSRRKWGQSAICAGLGAIPGCLGAFTVASFYMHRVITLGAAVAAMIATCGDEAFVMLAMFPERALGLMGTLFLVGIGVGVATDAVLKGRRTAGTRHLAAYRATHPEQTSCVPFSRHQILNQWRHCSPHRGWLSFLLLLFLAAVMTGRLGHHHLGEAHSEHGQPALERVHDRHDEHIESETERHDAWDWVRTTLLALGLIGLAIVVTVPDHFLDEHLWNHIARVHIWRIFFWTIGALIVTPFLVTRIDVAAIVETHKLPVLLLACLIGIIPESGPHLVFVTLYADGVIPFSTLLAGSIVQDGHGMLPLLAHSRRAYMGIKAINIAAGLAAGLAGQFMGW